MTFVSHETAGAPEASRDVNTSRAEYTVRWRLTTDNAADGAAAATDYVLANIAARDDHYSYGNDEDESAKLRTIVPKREAGSLTVWIATLTYSDPDPNSGDKNEGQDGSGAATSNPLEFAPEVEVQTVQYQRPVEYAIHRGGFKGTALLKIPIGRTYPIVNSVFVPYDPPVQRDDHRMVVRVLRNVASLNCNTIKCNVVNTEEFRLDYRGIIYTVPARASKTRDVSVRQASVTLDNQIIRYVQVQLFLDCLTRGSWWHKVLDQGYHKRGFPGDPNGHGGDDFNFNDFPPGKPPISRFTDPDGFPVNEPVLLDGDGHELITANGNVPDPVWIRWEDYEEDDFKTWGIFEGIIGG